MAEGSELCRFCLDTLGTHEERCRAAFYDRDSREIRRCRLRIEHTDPHRYRGALPKSKRKINLYRESLH